MNFKRIGRILVCLVLVCALIVQISPLRAKAVGVSSIVIPAGLALGAILLGLGVSGATESGDEIIDDVVSSAQDFLEATTGWISDGMVTAYLTGDMTKPYAFPIALIQALFDWTYDSGVIYASLSGGKYFPAGSHISRTSDIYWVWYDQPVYCYIFDYANAADVFVTVCAVSGVELYLDSSWGLKQTFSPPDGFNNCWSIATDFDKTACIDRGIPIVSQSGTMLTAADSVRALLNGELGDGLSVDTDKDLTLGEVAPAGSTVASGYATWTEGAITVPKGEIDDGPVVVVPTGIATVPNAGKELTQADVWAGLGTYVDTGGELDPGGSEDTETDGKLFTEVTITTFIAKLLADLTRALFGTQEMTLTEIFEKVLMEIKTLGQTIVDALTQLLEGIQTLFQTLTQILVDALTYVFVPSETFIPTKVQELITKYGHLETFLALGTDLKAFFVSLGAQPPIIYIDLGAGSGFYPMGGKTVFVDLTWYAEYKGTVDAILGGLIWLWLAWRVFMSIPGIISGQSGIWGAPKNDTGEKSTALALVDHQRR